MTISVTLIAKKGDQALYLKHLKVNQFKLNRKKERKYDRIESEIDYR